MLLRCCRTVSLRASLLLVRMLMVGMVCGLFVVAAQAETKKSPGATATHKQIKTLRPTRNGQPVELHTFCCDSAGNLWCCVSDRVQQGTHRLQVYSPEFSLIHDFPLTFQATAINFAPDGSLFLAGSGQMCHLASDGKVLKQGNTPNIKNLEQFKKDAVAAMEADQKNMSQVYQSSLNTLQEQLKTLEKTPEAKRNAAQSAQVEALKNQVKAYENVLTALKQGSIRMSNVTPESAMASKGVVTGMAASDKDVFVCCAALKGTGYEVWRTSYELTGGERVVEKLSGCCGNLDIQVQGGELLAAENGRFRVNRYDRDGKSVSYFGKRSRTDLDGFGSCCNPMNVRCLADGSLLVAESSIGNIKKFTPDGKFVALIGKAKVAAGCKNVALGYDQSRDRYYMLREDLSQICVLGPVSENPGPTEEELRIAAARAGLGAKLVGSWSTGKKESGKPSAGRRILSFSSAGQTPFESIEFHDDQKLTVKGGLLEIYATSSSEIGWEAVAQEDNTLHIVITMDGIEYFNAKIHFEKDGSIQCSDCPYLPGDRLVRKDGKAAAIASRPQENATKTAEKPAAPQTDAAQGTKKE